MTTRLFFISLLLTILCLTAQGQTNQLLRKQALQAERQKDWNAAAQYWQRLYFRDSTNMGWLQSYAEASRLVFDVDVALRLYVKLAAQDNGRIYPLSFYHIAQLEKNKMQYKLAQQWFSKFLKLKVGDRKAGKLNLSYYRQRAKIEIEACDLAQINVKYPVPYQPEKLDATINSRQSEYAPMEKDSVLYFSSLRMPERKTGDDDGNDGRPFYSKIYRSDIRNQKYKKIKLLDTSFNSNVYHAANVTFSPDGKLMIVSRCSSKNASEFGCELYQSLQVKTRWLAPSKMEAPVNQPSFSTTQPNFGQMGDKTVLFFASDRPGGEGGLDIWYCYRDKTGGFSDPVNAGKNVNTPEDEVTPFFDSKTSTLYFSSPYHKGMGGIDIFKSQWKDGVFQEPVNAGYPLNSSHNDLYYSVSNGGNHVYLSSNRVGSMFDGRVNCCSDIYKFNVDTTVVRPPAIDSSAIVKEKMKLLVPLTLYFHNDEPEPRTTVTVTAKNYVTTYNEYKALLPQYQKEFGAGLKGKEIVQATDLVNNFFADSVDAGVEGLLKFTDLLKQTLAKGETVRITMKGYCSPLASTNYNVNLAKRRISSLRNYFREADNGYFLKYIDNPAAGQGRIIMEDVDIGELPASKVSDNFKDKRNSVYSPGAAAERKIQIIAVSFQ